MTLKTTKPQYFVLPMFLLVPLSANCANDISAQFSLEDLLNLTITTASFREENILDAPGIVNVITQSDIQNYHANNLLDLLSMLPSVINGSTGRFQSNTVNIRGHEYTQYNLHVLYLINGRPVRGGSTTGIMEQVINGIPLSAIKQIEVIRGPGSVLYGSNAFAGVINIKTKFMDDNETENWLSFKSGSFGTRQLEAGFNSTFDELNLGLAIKYSEADGEQFAYSDRHGTILEPRWFDEDLGVIVNASYAGLTLNAGRFRRGAYKLQDGFVWEIDLPEGLTLQDIDDPNIYPNSNADHYEHDVVDLSYKTDISDEHKFSVFYTRNKMIWRNGNKRAFDGTTSDLFELRFLGRLSESLDYVIGAVSEQTEAIPSLEYPSGEIEYMSIYWQSSYYATDNLKLIAGIQWNKPAGLKKNISPRFGVIYHFDDNWSIKALNGHAYRSPTMADLFTQSSVAIANPDVEPETVNTTDLELSYQSDSLKFSFNLYQSIVDGLITRTNVLVPGDDPDTLVSKSKIINGEGITYRGVEFDSQFILSEYIDIFANASWQTNEDEATSEEGTIVFPEYMIKFGFLYQGKKFSASLYTSYLSAPPLTSEIALNPSPKDVYLLTSAITFDLNEYLTNSILKLSIDNILDEEVWNSDYHRRRVHSTRIRPGRSFFADLTWKF